MLSIYLDFITVIWATGLLIMLPSLVWTKKSSQAFISLIAVILYLSAQTGWTTAYFSGNVFGAAVSNYIWFAFNFSVLLLITNSIKGAIKNG